ncbi:ribokinase [Halomonas urumqiensis]|uniref:Ribokinase n=1 Tax=Halomonas urumqiensis TaxID=1684789 RepID=A0A2N7UPK9_9GAMM|nr:ribokinase [Halomonas urumqiensis]PMR82375.1 ribokinase [Halomonas urumqiensis]PTB04146.1 ribokinase [Halomonas urumqiensis]GHE19586.1 ribokinase [Halomonas urumqiensis]
MLHNLGSINLDHFYRVSHLVTPGETISSHDYRVGLGGKGANQSLAMARAGGELCHWGRLNHQDAWARDALAEAGVDVSGVVLVDEPSGHAIIQVDDHGENAIILFPGANHGFETDELADRFAATGSDDWLLLQNECNALADAITLAAERGLAIAFNPAPMTEAVPALPLERCRLLFVNRTEAAQLTGQDPSVSAEALLDALATRLPDCETVLTLGGEGAWYQHAGQRLHQPALPVVPVDTTAAGDTFIGYYMAALQAGLPVAECLKRGATAAALGVQRQGAGESIPLLDEVEHALATGLTQR